MKTLGHRGQPQESSLWPNNISWWYLNEKLQELISSSQLLLEPSMGQYCKHNIVAGPAIYCMYILMPYCVLCPLMVIFMILWHKGVKSGCVTSMAFYFLHLNLGFHECFISGGQLSQMSNVPCMAAGKWDSSHGLLLSGLTCYEFWCAKTE